MRIRQVRPEFFTDAIVSRLTTTNRLTYIGLWCVADDLGFLLWDVEQIAVQLYPYESVRVRERRIAAAGEALVVLGRLVIYGCGCAAIPKLPEHQKIGGTKSRAVYDKHLVHSRMDESAGKVSNGSEGKLNGRASASEDDGKAAQLASFRRLGLPVDLPS